MRYPKLRFMLLKKGIKQSEIADALHISSKTFANKLNGKTNFSWDEVCAIQQHFFPEISKDELFATESEQQNKAS